MGSQSHLRALISSSHAVSEIGTDPEDSASAGVEFSPDIAEALLRYLSRRLGVPGLRYEQEPTPDTDGREAYIFHFQLNRAPSLPAAYRGPLTLKLFSGPLGAPRGRREFAVQRYLHERDYPVPAPVCWEENHAGLGGPFHIMEQVPGPTLLERVLYQPWMLLPVAYRLAQMQNLLHQLPLDGSFPCPAEPLLPRSLNEIREMIPQYDLHWLTPGLDWLVDHLPDPPQSPCIVHLDFHPINLIHRNHQLPVVLDWDAADIGDAHADIATTIVLMHCTPNVGKNTWERMMVAIGSEFLKQFYLLACRSFMALDRRRLRYYEAWAALRRLARFGRFLKAGPEVIGAKPSLTRHLHPDHVERLCRLFRRLTCVPLQAAENTWTALAT